MDDRLKKIQKLLDAAEADLHTARGLMREAMGLDENEIIDLRDKAKDLSVQEEGKVVQGIFNGKSMIGADRREYQVPANYASKSKLVEGDTLKLTIGDDGSYMFKQIDPTERKKLIGVLSLSDGFYTVSAEGKNYNVLQASITYYKGEPGDQVIIIVPKDHEAAWAAVENVNKKGDTGPSHNPDRFLESDKLKEKTEEPEVAAAEPSQEAETELSNTDQDLLNKLKPEAEEESHNTIHDLHAMPEGPLPENPEESQEQPKIADIISPDDQAIRELEI